MIVQNQLNRLIINPHIIQKNINLIKYFQMKNSPLHSQIFIHFLYIESNHEIKTHSPHFIKTQSIDSSLMMNDELSLILTHTPDLQSMIVICYYLTAYF